MALKDIVVQTHTVKVGPDQSFNIRGLSLSDLSKLLGPYRTEITGLFESKMDFSQLIVNFPEAVAAIIATAADEPESIDVVRKLPLEVQLEALSEVWNLTVLDDAALVKYVRSLVESVKGVARSAGPNLGKTD